MSVRVKGKQKEMEEFGWICETDAFKQDLKEVLDNPKGPIACCIISQVMPILNFASQNFSYGALERNSVVTKICELWKKDMGQHGCFL